MKKIRRHRRKKLSCTLTPEEIKDALRWSAEDVLIWLSRAHRLTQAISTKKSRQLTDQILYRKRT